MHGSVFEWCADSYDADYYKFAPNKDPQGPESGSDRVLRGGGWQAGGDSCRAGRREGRAPGYHCWDLGFRVCLCLD
jgi:formylglycine-generating enzyme required for sulfatase activity